MKWLLVGLVILGCIYVGAEQTVLRFGAGGLPASLIFSGINPKIVEQKIFDNYTRIVPSLLDLQKSVDVKNLRTQYVDINNDGDKDIIATYESPATCGSGGCMATIFLQNNLKSFEPIEFLYTIKSIEPLDTFTLGMRDLGINEGQTNHLIWNGSAYILEATK